MQKLQTEKEFRNYYINAIIVNKNSSVNYKLKDITLKYL